jgi:hypothetical protein
LLKLQLELAQVALMGAEVATCARRVAKQAGSSCIFGWNKLKIQIAQAHLKSVTAEVATLASSIPNCSQGQLHLQPAQVQHQLAQVALRTAEIATCAC